MRGLRLLERNRSRDLRRGQTPAEQELWRKNCADGSREQRLIVEVDGATHSTDEELAYDARREKFLAGEGYRILRVSNDEVFSDLDDVCETIFMALQTKEP